MDQTPASAHCSSFLNSSSPKDARFLEATSSLSSSVPAAPFHHRNFQNTIGLGISGCGVEPSHDHQRGFPPQLPFSLTASLPNQLAPPNNLHIFPDKVNDGSDRPCYGVYSNLSETTPSPLNYYGSQTMSVSPSYDSPTEVGTVPASYQGQFPGYWPPAVQPGPRNPSEIVPVDAHCMTGSHYDQQYISETRIAADPPALPLVGEGMPHPQGGYAPIMTEDGSSKSVSPRKSSHLAPGFSHTRSLSPDENDAQASSEALRWHGMSLPTRRLRSDRKYPCQFCGFTFTRRSNCVEHEKKHNPNFKRSYPCDECPKSFGRNADLKRHTDIVSGTFGDQAQ